MAEQIPTMNKLTHYLLAIAVVFFMISCQKETDGDDPVPPNPPEEREYLSAITTIFNLKDSIRKEVETFKYDSLKRVVEISTLSTIIKGSILDTFVTSNLCAFDYQGTETQPYRCTKRYNYLKSNKSLESTTYLYWYNGKQKIKDSSIYKYGTGITGGEPPQATFYTYNNDKIYTWCSYERFVPFVVFQDTLSISNGNVIKIKNPRKEVTIQYDSRHNPITDLNIANSYYISGERFFMYYDGLMANNPTNKVINDLKDDSTGTPIKTATFNYTYNATGYPLTVAKSDPVNAPYDDVSITYEYKKL